MSIFITKFQDSMNSMRPSSKTLKFTWLKYFLPISMIILGCLDVDKCPGQPLLPKWLIVMGLASIIDGLIDVYFVMKNRNAEEPYHLPLVIDVFSAFISIFAIVWQILGSIWVYRASISYDPSSPSYCDKGLYIYSVVMASYPYVFIGIVCILLLIIVIFGRLYVWYRNSRQGSQQEPLV